LNGFWIKDDKENNIFDDASMLKILRMHEQVSE
jgi:hypothetical protein